jgi:hypothetical protein
MALEILREGGVRGAASKAWAIEGYHWSWLHSFVQTGSRVMHAQPAYVRPG